MTLTLTPVSAASLTLSTIPAGYLGFYPSSTTYPSSTLYPGAQYYAFTPTAATASSLTLTPA